MRRLVPPICLLFCCLGCGARPFVAQTPPPPASVDFSAFAPQVARIVAAARSDRGAFQKLTALCDGIGHRLSGSVGLERAIAWAQAAMRADGLVNVRAEPVDVPRWVRGQESLALVTPRAMPLTMLGLGSSVATPPDGVTAEVVVVHDEQELKAQADAIRGKIVLFDNPMPQYTVANGAQYGETVRFRGHGAAMAGKLGAVAVLVRSVTAHSLATPHTGNTRYEDGVPKIPAAAIATEHAALLARLVAGGEKVTVRLRMEAHSEGVAQSANVLAELPGRERPEEVVVIGGHLDSWDVGQGAQDDGAGCVMAMQAVALLKQLGLQPRRTIRVVLWTNEENGLAGGKAYAQMHADELVKTVAALEADSGAFRPEALTVEMADEAQQVLAAHQLRDLVGMLPRMQLAIHQMGSGADVSAMKIGSVPLVGLVMESSTYFDYHHTAADTLDKVDPVLLAEGEALFAALAWTLAEWPGRLGR
jgi:carboxypeptidase Q